MKVHRFLVGLDPKINIMVNVLNPKMLQEVYDLSKRLESNLGIKLIPLVFLFCLAYVQVYLSLL